MSDRAYILLHVTQGKSDLVAQVLRGQSGVRVLDVLEGPPDLMLMMEASGRQQLAELTIRALASVEPMTEGLQVLPAQPGWSQFEPSL